MGTVNYTIPLCEGTLLALHYLNETESESVGAQAGCNGSPQEPVADPGNLCVFTGGFKGINEKQWKNAKFNKILGTNGNPEEATPAGQEIVFRTTEFKEEGPLKLAKEAYLGSGGGWQVRAP